MPAANIHHHVWRLLIEHDVSWEYQWFAGGSEISGATGTSLTLTDSHEGKAIKVRVDFEDDGGNSESLTSAATVAVAPKPVPLTATLTGVPANHSGSGTEFQFTLTFSENIKAGYVKMRDLVSTLDGADITRARQATQGSNLEWLPTVKVDADRSGAVPLTLPATTDCSTARAICSKVTEGKILAQSLIVSVPGPSQ